MIVDDYDGALEIERAWREGLRPDPRLTVSEWAERYRMLGTRESAEPGRWRIVGARGPASIRRMGGDPDKPLPDWVGQINPKTGAPVGIDKGFAYQAGATWRPWDKNAFASECLLSGLAALTAGNGEPCIRAVANQVTWQDKKRLRIRDVPDSQRLPFPGLLPAAGNRDLALAMLASELGVSPENQRRWVQMNVPVKNDGGRILIDYGYLAHMVEKDGDRRERYAKFILPTLTDPFEVWATRYDDGTIRRRLIGLFLGKKQIAVILRINKDGSLFWNMINASDRRLDDFRNGELLYGK